MDIQSNRKAALLVTAMALGFGTAFAIDAISNAGSSLGVFVNSAQAAEGHDSGSSGGHSGGKGSDKGGSSHSSGGHDSGSKGSDKGGSSHSSGGHDSGSTHGGTEEKGHGTKMQHKGHSSGSHGSGSSHSRSERFGGGSGLSGNAQVPDGVGRYGDGAPAASAEGRTRYWGGWTLPVPDAPAPDAYVASTASVSSSSGLIPGSGSGPTVSSRSVLDGPTRCEGVVAGMPASQQFGGSNLLRLNAARGLVDPQLAASGKIAPPYVMGSLQQELIKSAPNAELAGTYLGLIAKAPVTADTVKQISRQVCGSVSDAAAKEIAAVAETQRQTLTAASEAAAAEKANQ